jgi:RNA polymerase sigma factor (TIGR02999 family)
VAALAMRRILINHAKTRDRDKRGAGAMHVPLETAERLGVDALGFGEEQSDDLIALDEALTRLREFNPEGATVVEYRFFGGLQFNEIAEVLGVSEVTVRRRWAAARAWLGRDVRGRIAHAGSEWSSSCTRRLIGGATTASLT